MTREMQEEYSFHFLEEQIRSAGNWVHPSDDLRPQVIETAKEELAQRRDRRWTAQCLIAILLIGSVTLPLANRLRQTMSKFRSPTATELQEQAVRYSAARPADQCWGLTEAFNQLRTIQAEQIAPLKSYLIYHHNAN